MFNIIHVTHEAVYKVGGIGTVLEGLINSRHYRDSVGRTVLVCPLFYPENPQRLGPGGVIEYSSLDQQFDGQYAEALGIVERDFNVRIVYGHRPIDDAPTARRTMCEVLLVDIRGINRDRVNDLKGRLWQNYGIQSHRHERIWEFEQYVQLAGPAAAALEALRIATEEQPAVVFAHEFMGLPTALALQCDFPAHYRTLFHAHETAPIRRIVESHPGLDVMFYNALELAAARGQHVEQVFGPQSDYFKFPLVEAAHHCDGVLAVGHHVLRELKFLSPAFENADITLAFNGVPSSRCSPERRTASRERIRDYCEGLLGWRPDRIFTHVTRLARSKAMWRDFDVLSALDARLNERGETAVMISLATEMPRRPLADILKMEREWNWPLAHREGHPDLTDGEAHYYEQVQAFNARAHSIHALYINQFGFSPSTCGRRVPDDVDTLDLRLASDVEFGLSAYEPFGISPLETLTYGGLCVISTSCGCAGFHNQAAAGRRSANTILADYIGASPDTRPENLRDALAIDEKQLHAVEREIGEKVADEIIKRLPQDEAASQKLMRSGYELARRMSWDVVAERFIFPAIQRAVSRRRVLHLRPAANAG